MHDLSSLSTEKLIDLGWESKEVMGIPIQFGR